MEVRILELPAIARGERGRSRRVSDERATARLVERPGLARGEEAPGEDGLGLLDLDAVGENLSRLIDGKPLMGMCTYGEQGQTPNGASQHGNLMYSMLIFGKGTREPQRGV